MAWEFRQFKVEPFQTYLHKFMMKVNVENQWRELCGLFVPLMFVERLMALR